VRHKLLKRKQANKKESLSRCFSAYLTGGLLAGMKSQNRDAALTIAN